MDPNKLIITLSQEAVSGKKVFVFRKATIQLDLIRIKRQNTGPLSKTAIPS